MSAIAVTGATGYIGSHIVETLLEKGFDVHAIVRDLNASAKLTHLENLQKRYSPQRVRLYQADLAAGDCVLQALQGCEAAIHTAAVVEWNVKNPQRNIVDRNLRITRNVLAAIEKSPNIKRLLYSSAVNTMWSYRKSNSCIFSDQDWNAD